MRVLCGQNSILIRDEVKFNGGASSDGEIVSLGLRPMNHCQALVHPLNTRISVGELLTKGSNVSVEIIATVIDLQSKLVETGIETSFQSTERILGTTPFNVVLIAVSRCKGDSVRDFVHLNYGASEILLIFIDVR